MNQLYKALLLLFCVVTAGQVSAQKTKKDTLRLDTINITDRKPGHLPDISGANIFAGKRTLIVNPDPGRANLANNNARMLFGTYRGLTFGKWMAPVCS